jgi:hypothetical protein
MHITREAMRNDITRTRAKVCSLHSKLHDLKCKVRMIPHLTEVVLTFYILTIQNIGVRTVQQTAIYGLILLPNIISMLS